MRFELNIDCPIEKMEHVPALAEQFNRQPDAPAPTRDDE